MRKIGKKLNRSLACGIAVALTSALLGHFSVAWAAEQPSFFDWRLNNPTQRDSGTDSLSIVPGIKDQGPLNTCWAFSAVGTYESSWMRQLKEAKNNGVNVTPQMPNFSERYLAWMTYATATKEKNTDKVARYETSKPIYNSGGYIQSSVMTALNKGVVNNADSPYADVMMAFEKMNNEADSIVKDSGITDTDQGEGEFLRNQVAAQLWKKYQFEEAYAAVTTSITPVGLLHDTYSNFTNHSGELTDAELKKIKEMIVDRGIVSIAHCADPQAVSVYERYGEWYATNAVNHAETLVGWDDNYSFKIKDENGNALKGGFIMRNSWGTEYYPISKGYGMISYKDPTITDLYFHEAELDGARYTINANHAPVVEYTLGQVGDDDKLYTEQPIAASFEASQNHFLKAVMFYASGEGMKYEINVRNGATPGTGNVLYTQSGTFGENGLVKYAGFRTIDLDKYVLLPKGQQYTVEVTTISTDGRAVETAFQVNENGDTYSYEGHGASYYYDFDEDRWVSNADIENQKFTSLDKYNITGDEKHGTGVIVVDEDDAKLDAVQIFLVARGRETSSANGGDFTVSCLDDSSSDNSSVIYLGKKSELYGRDAADPNRKTLSNMTVDIDESFVDQYGGTITGEGGVTKVGAGSLILTGDNTYTGMTTVKEGWLTVNGSIAADVSVTDKGTLGGKGQIGGTLYNHGNAVAGYEDIGTLSVNALDSTGGTLMAVTDEAGGNTSFLVNNLANVTDATVLVDKAMPEASYKVVSAGSISGTPSNIESNPSVYSGLMSEYSKVVGNNVYVNTVFSDNLGEASSQQQEAMQAMARMYRSLPEDKRGEMYSLYQLDADGAKEALSDISSVDASQLASFSQHSSIVSQVIGERLNTAFATANVQVPLPASHLDGGESQQKGLVAPMKLPLEVDNNAWVKYTKHWGNLSNDANYHSQGISGGYDYALGANWRVGAFISYNSTGYGAETAGGNIYDTRIGLYGGYQRGAGSGYLYLDYGSQRNSLRRNVMGYTANADYQSHLWELGGEYKYDLHAMDGKTWHVSPYVGWQLSYLTQGGYGETGAGIYNQHTHGLNNTYFALQTGVECKRYLGRGSYSVRLGVKHGLSGVDPSLAFHYEGDDTNRYMLKNSQDKTHFLMSLAADTEFAPGWQLAGDVMLQKGSHDKDITASVMVRRMW